MSSLLWPQRRRGPAAVPMDTVIPVHSFDDNKFIRPLVMYLLMRFDDVLDAQALRTSLEKLLSRDGWRRLGARLRLNDQNKLEYHVPARFDDQRPAIAYYHERFDISVKEHPVASKLPAADAAKGDVPQLMGSPDDSVSLMRQDGDPTSIDDWLYSDRPLLGLRIVSFDDATLVTLSWSHVVLDGMGRKALYDAWSLVLHGHEDQVPPFHGFATDPLTTLGTNPREEYKQVGKQMSTWQLLMLGARMFVSKLWNPPSSDEMRAVFIPASFAQHLRDTAMADINSEPTGSQQQQQPPPPALVANGAEDRKPFVSEGDVICAWWARRIVAAQLPATSTRTVAVHVVFNLRWLLRGDLLPSHSAYLSNAAITVPAFLPARELLAKPLGQVAVAIRSALQTLGTREQAEAFMACARAATARGSAFVLGDAWMQMVMCSNWTKGKFFQIDFSGAVQWKGQPGAQGAGAGRPSYLQPFGYTNGSSLANAFSITGKDARGNIWIHGTLPRGQSWPAVEEALAKGAV